MHSGVKEFTGNICKQAFRFATDLRRHNKMCHDPNA